MDIDECQIRNQRNKGVVAVRDGKNEGKRAATEGEWEKVFSAKKSTKWKFMVGNKL